MPPASAIALLERSRKDPFARYCGREIDVDTFLKHVSALRRQLPVETHIFNLLPDRYEFTVAFAAIVAAGKCNVLPASPRPAALARLAAQLPDAAIIHTGVERYADIKAFVLPGLDASGAGENPGLDPHQLAALTFTSGSSGTARPVRKLLRTLRGAATVYEDALIPTGSSIVATVPAQHMYGLELGSLQAFWSPVHFSAGRPMFPADVQAELDSMTGSRVLVTTPLHLRALLESGLKFASLNRVLCATAPLDGALARRAEDVLGAPVLDVYGCSEAGCLATRRAASTEEWTALPGITFHDAGHAQHVPTGAEPGQQIDGQAEDPPTLVSASHLEAPVPLGDRLDLSGSGRFHLAGRLGDMINVAGKRGSLGEITRLMLEVNGVEDAAALLPTFASGKEQPADTQRPAALYVGSADAASIRQHLGEVLDPVFIPRPLLQVPELPRTATSKLPREALMACFEQHRRRR